MDFVIVAISTNREVLMISTASYERHGGWGEEVDSTGADMIFHGRGVKGKAASGTISASGVIGVALLH